MSIDQKNGPSAAPVAPVAPARDGENAPERLLERLIPALLILFVLKASLTRPTPALTGRGLAVSVSVAVFVLAALVVRGRPGPPRAADIVILLTLLGSSVALIWAQWAGPGVIAMFSCVIFFARRLHGRAAVVVPVLAFALLEGISAIATGSPVSPALLAALGGFYGTTFLAIRLGEANKRSQRLLIELEASRSAEARAAGLAERQRLAREMHDVLAHSLSGQMIQLDGARILASQDPQDPRLIEVLDRARQLGRAGLDEARRATGMLRDEELPGPERLDALTAEFQASRGIPCRLTVTGEQRPLDPEARLAIYRVAQEALTNITKHVTAHRVEMLLAYEPSAIRLTVEDFTTANGTRPAPDGERLGGGYGLVGMRERAELLGGSLATQRTTTGFRVELDVPA